MNNSLVKQANSVTGAVEYVGSNNVSVATQSAKVLAEVQGKVFMAKQYPRNIVEVQNKILASCERKSLAEVAEYEYPRGGTKITGASTKLLEVIAQCYGNIHYTWKELNRDLENHKSLCIAEAWDLENNISSSLEFEVPHVRTTKSSGTTILTDERDIYEMVANNASRRVRRCLENVVPRDLVDLAREQCSSTLTKGVDIQKGIDKGIQFLNETYGITLKQIETYFGMGRQGFNNNQYVKLQKLAVSFKDGLVSPESVFPQEQKDLSNQSIAPKEEAKQEQPKPSPSGTGQATLFEGKF